VPPRKRASESLFVEFRLELVMAVEETSMPEPVELTGETADCVNTV
jgi:hypothetical protein